MKELHTPAPVLREDANMGWFLRASECLTGRQSLPVDFPGIRDYMVLSRKDDPYWCVPTFGTAGDGFEADGQFLLWRDSKGRHHIFIPLVSQGCRSVLKSRHGGFQVETEAPEKGSPHAPLIAYESESDDLYGMLEEAAEEISRALKTVRSRNEKSTPAWVNLFGWCTWDAFYQEISEEHLMAGLSSWHSGGLNPGFLILDDGWLDVKDDLLCSLNPDAHKFPNGLKKIVEEAKERYGIAAFGLWHTLQGYWAGINPNSELARRWPLHHTRNAIRPWLGDHDQEMDLYLLSPASASLFYHDFYERLREAGIDLVKVDGQSALELFTEGDLDRVRSMQLYQEALQGAAAAHLNGQTLHCMSHGSDVILNLDYSTVIRNSSDYLPDWDCRGHQGHIIRNVFNALYTSLFGLPDWDMFQTCHLHSPFHAAARAISGGPVYVSDKPGMQDFELIERLVCFDKGAAETLRCPQPALPSPSSLYRDPATSGEVLKCFNHVNGIGLLGLFHCSDITEALSTCVTIADLPILDSKASYAVWLVRSEKLHIVRPGQCLHLHLERMEYEIAIFSKIRNGCAPIGLIDKLNPPAALNQIVNENAFVRVATRDGGRLAFYTRNSPQHVELDNLPAPFVYEAESGMLIVRTPDREPHNCRIILKS